MADRKCPRQKKEEEEEEEGEEEIKETTRRVRELQCLEGRDARLWPHAKQSK